jgi:hypothetical protein
VVLVLIWLAGTFVAVVLATSAVGIVGNRVSTDPLTRVDDDTEESALATSTTTSEPAVPSSDPPADPTSPEIIAVPSPGPSGGAVFPGAVASADDGIAPEPSAQGPATTLAPPAPAPAPAVVRRTFSGPGGTVGVECTGSVIGLLYATPSAGYEIHGAMDTGPGEIDVRFRPVGGGDEWRLRARCESGAPVEKTDG